MQQDQYVSGLFAKAKHPKAPSFVVCGLSAKREELIAFLESQEGEWVNMQVKIARDGQKLYVALDTWKKEAGYSPKGGHYRETEDDARDTVEVENDDGSVTIQYPEESINPDDIPF